MFLEALALYMDANNLIGTVPNPTPSTSGNPSVLAAVASIIAEENQETSPVLDQISDGLKRLQMPNGMVMHKSMSPDETTHDDMIGWVSFMSQRNETASLSKFLSFAQENNWVLSSTGKDYWEAFPKPWDVAFYLTMSGYRIDAFRHFALIWSIIWSAFFDAKHPSNLQLVWIKLKRLKGKSFFVDLAAKLWWHRFGKAGWTSKRLMIAYHGERHPFAIYCLE